MRGLLSRSMGGLSRLAAVLTTLLAGMAFVVVSGAVAAPVKEKEEIKKPEKVEALVKAEKLDSKARFNKNFNNNFNRNDIGIRNFNRNFNPFFFNRAFDADGLFGKDRD